MLKKVLVAAAVLAIPAGATAHHGWTSYDEKKVIKVRTSLSDVKWGNPHGSASVRYNNATWHVVLARAIGEADIEVAQAKRRIHGAETDFALAGHACQSDGVALTPVDAGVTDGAPAALVPAPLLRRRRGDCNQSCSGRRGSKDKGTSHL